MLKFHIIIIKFSILTAKNSQIDTFFPKLENTIANIDKKSFSVKVITYIIIPKNYFASTVILLYNTSTVILHLILVRKSHLNIIKSQ